MRRLVNAREAIRRKYSILKRNKAFIEKAVGETFKPLVDPLDELVTFSEKRFDIVPKSVKVLKNNIENKSGNTFEELSDVDIDMIPYDSAQEASDSTIQASKTIDENDSPITEYTQLLSSRSRDLDKLYGIYEDGKLQLGNSKVSLYNGNIIVKNEEYPLSRGSLELLFKKEPNVNVITQDDFSYYRQIMDLTSAHKRNFQEDNALRRHKSRKFNSIIYLLFEVTEERGFLPKYKIAKFNTSKDYVYWDDPNELVDRLRLLVAERSAGNNAHDNETCLRKQERTPSRKTNFWHFCILCFLDYIKVKKKSK